MISNSSSVYDACYNAIALNKRITLQASLRQTLRVLDNVFTELGGRNHCFASSNDGVVDGVITLMAANLQYSVYLSRAGHWCVDFEDGWQAPVIRDDSAEVYHEVPSRDIFNDFKAHVVASANDIASFVSPLVPESYSEAMNHDNH